MGRFVRNRALGAQLTLALSGAMERAGQSYARHLRSAFDRGPRSGIKHSGLPHRSSAPATEFPQRQEVQNPSLYRAIGVRGGVLSARVGIFPRGDINDKQLDFLGDTRLFVDDVVESREVSEEVLRDVLAFLGRL